MFVKRLQLTNYGPIENLDIEFPFEGEDPKPVVLVGENGSGKSILLSHIVNGLIAAKGVAFPETPEVEQGKVYKLRSNSYISPGSEYYYSRVDFDGAFFTSEIRTWRSKQEYTAAPAGISETAAQGMWDKMDPKENDHYDSNLTFDPSTTKRVEEKFAKNCVLYFPFNRFEEPAWLNEENLKAQARYMDSKHLTGHTSRKVIASSPLHVNQNWLFDVVYDRSAFEIQHRPISVDFSDGRGPVSTTEFQGYSGDSTNTFEIACQILRSVMRRIDVRFGIGKRHNRVVSIMHVLGLNPIQLVPNVFQLSSGETSLLNLFLSILRDFDLCGAPLTRTVDIRGIVVVDEIDLHLHAVHQHEVLPNLIRMFPNVQFVVTTHSPLFVLGMQRAFGEDGFALYRLPQGHQISPEEFSEFGKAYRAFTETVTYSNDIRSAIEMAQKPIVFVEGETDLKYILKASQLLNEEATIERVEIRDGNGESNLKKVWTTSKHIEIVTQKFLLLFDCENQDLCNADRGALYRRIVPMQNDNPIQKGIENLFGRDTLERAKQHKSAFIDIDPQFTRMVRGKPQLIPEKWVVNKDEKTNLCDWLCENGTKEDFQGFQVILDLLKDVLDLLPESSGEVEAIEHVSLESPQDEGAAVKLKEPR